MYLFGLNPVQGQGNVVVVSTAVQQVERITVTDYAPEYVKVDERRDFIQVTESRDLIELT